MARLRVIYNVREAIAAHQAVTGEDHYTYIYYYAFSSALEEVIEELGRANSTDFMTPFEIGTCTTWTDKVIYRFFFRIARYSY